MKNYVVITGASFGIGKSLAYRYAKEGYNLILIARSKKELNDVKEEINKIYGGVNVVIKVYDLANYSNINKLIMELNTYEIDVMINNAGFGYYHLIEKQDIEKVDSMIDLNIRALTHLSTFFVNRYIDTEDNKYLINISSSGGYVNVPTAVTYCASKFYVSSFTEGLSKELEYRNSNLKAKVFAPSVTETEFGKRASGNMDYQYNNLFDKYNTSDEVADYVYKLMKSDYIVGYINRESYNLELTDIKFEYDFSRLK